MTSYKLKLYLNHERSTEERIGTLGFEAGPIKEAARPWFDTRGVAFMSEFRLDVM